MEPQPRHLLLCPSRWGDVPVPLSSHRQKERERELASCVASYSKKWAVADGRLDTISANILLTLQNVILSKRPPEIERDGVYVGR